jgi:HTH-type transcriptional regulator/antitoxin HigA
MTSGIDRDEYGRLVATFPPVKIRDGAQADETEARIEALLAKPGISEAERAYVDLLSDLLADWEDSQVDIPDIYGSELVKVLLREGGLRQRDLVGVFPTESIISEVLSGRRELTREHIEALAGFFHVSPAVFFPVQSYRSAPTRETKRLLAPNAQDQATEQMATGRS